MQKKYVELTITDGQQEYEFERVVFENKNVVLLGIPGSGKSILLKHFYEKHKDECEFIKVKEFVKMPLMLKNNIRYFLLDGLDELRCASSEKEAIIYDIVAKLKDIEKKSHTLISCREMDWYGDNDDAALEKYLSYPVKKVYIAPLSEEQKKAFVDIYLASSNKIDDFKSRILSNRDFREILNVPQTLVMLLNLFREDQNNVSTRKIDLYEKFVKFSLEQKPAILRESKYSLSEDEVFKYAGYIAYFYMMSDLDDIDEKNLLKISESHSYDIDKLKSVIKLNLFDGKDHKIFSHRTIAEYLCAHFLFEKKMKKDCCSEEEVLSWFFAENKKIPSELRGVYAWFCSMTESEKCFSIDPYGQFIYGDNSLFKIESKKKVVDAIGRYANQIKPYFMHIGDAYRKEGFYEPDLDLFLIEKYREGLKDKNNFLLFLSFIMTSATEPTPTILQFSKEIVARKDLEFHFKKMFIGYLEKDVVYLQERLKEIIHGETPDPEDEFLDSILTILYPKIIKPSEIINYLKKYKKHDCYHNQFRYLSKKIISFEDLSDLVKIFYSEKKLQLNDKLDLRDAIESIIGNYFLSLLNTHSPNISLQIINSLAQQNFDLTNRSWFSKIKNLQNLDENKKSQLYSSYLVCITPNNLNERNDVYWTKKYNLQTFISTILPSNYIEVLGQFLDAKKTKDFKLEILFEMYTRLRSDIKTSSDAKQKVSRLAEHYDLRERFEKGIDYNPSPEIAEMIRKNEEDTLEINRKIKEMVDANRLKLSTMSNEEKGNLWGLLVNCAEFYLILDEKDVESRLGLCLENYHEMLLILKDKLFQNPKKRVYYEYTNIQSLVKDAPSAGRNVDDLYYAMLCLNNSDDYEKINDEEFLEYLYLIALHESHVVNSKDSDFLNWFESKRLSKAVDIVQKFILLFFEGNANVLKKLKAFYLKMLSKYRDDERLKYLEKIKSIVYFTEKDLSKQEEIADKLMHFFDFQLDADLLNSFDLTGNLAAKRDSLVKFINRDSSVNKDDVKYLIDIIGFRWHSFSIKSIINDYQYLFIKSMMLFFDSSESMAFHSGIQSNIDSAAFYVSNVMLNQLNGEEGKKVLNELLEDCESVLWNPMLKTRIEEIDEILTDSLKTKRTIDEAKKIILRKKENTKVTMNNYFNGLVNNPTIVGSAENSTVTVNINQAFDFNKVIELINQIEANIDKADFSCEQKTEIQSDVQKIRIAVNKKDTSIIHSALNHIKNICDGVTGSLIATGISGMIGQFLS